MVHLGMCGPFARIGTNKDPPIGRWGLLTKCVVEPISLYRLNWVHIPANNRSQKSPCPQGALSGGVKRDSLATHHRLDYPLGGFLDVAQPFVVTLPANASNLNVERAFGIYEASSFDARGAGHRYPLMRSSSASFYTDVRKNIDIREIRTVGAE